MMSVESYIASMTRSKFEIMSKVMPDLVFMDPHLYQPLSDDILIVMGHEPINKIVKKYIN